MARGVAATKERPAAKKDAKPAAKSSRKPAAAKSTDSASSSGDELAALALAGKELEDEQRAQTGNQNSFITLVKSNGQVLDKNNPSFMKGVKPLDYVITNKKVNLGAKLDVTVLGMFKVYAEVKRSDAANDMPKTVGFWMPEQAMQFEIADGSIFDRALPNGNILQPVHWVFVYLHNNPDIDDAIIAFRSKGNSIYAALQKTVKAESSVVTELRFEVSNQDIYNEKYKKTDYYPKFEIVGRNYRLTEEGKILKDKSTNIDAATLKEILIRAKQIQEDYKGLRMVAKRNVAALTGPAQDRPALPAGENAAYEDDEDEEQVHF
jgi:hypothetical protein